MSKYLTKQLELTRNKLLSDVKKLDAGVIDVQPDGLNNTIHWHIGHILTVAEKFLFGYPEKSQHVPENYIGLFGNGTKPADWTGVVPTVEELTKQLTEQLGRIKQIPTEHFEKVLEQPIFGQNTFGELAAVLACHEANHIGQIHAMNFTVKAAGK
jgi:uncharacterized damage-inducible protein DinB